MKLVTKIWNAIRPKTQKEIEAEYLSNSTDHADLERRIKKLENSNLSGWA